MKRCKKVVEFFLLIAGVAGIVISDGAISKERFEHLPRGLQDVLAACVMAYGIASFWVWIYYYLRIRYQPLNGNVQSPH